MTGKMMPTFPLNSKLGGGGRWHQEEGPWVQGRICVDREVEEPFCASVKVMWELFSPVEPKNRSSRYRHGEWARDQLREEEAQINMEMS